MVFQGECESLWSRRKKMIVVGGYYGLLWTGVVCEWPGNSML